MTEHAAAFRIHPDAMPAWEALQDALGIGTPCMSGDADLWHGSAKQQRVAADRCMDCPVLVACATYARTAGEQLGTWGGLTDADRRQERARE